MSTFIRWWKFNLVGAMGMVLQLAVLAFLDRWAPDHYLCTSAAAIEIALLHNFVWHLHYTWRDRRDDSTLLAQLVRFHLSNGLVSMLGNLALMRILVHDARIPLLVANSIAILCCSIVNFCLGNNWAFPARGHKQVRARRGRVSPRAGPTEGNDGFLELGRLRIRPVPARRLRACQKISRTT